MYEHCNNIIIILLKCPLRSFLLQSTTEMQEKDQSFVYERKCECDTRCESRDSFSYPEEQTDTVLL